MVYMNMNNMSQTFFTNNYKGFCFFVVSRFETTPSHMDTYMQGHRHFLTETASTGSVALPFAVMAPFMLTCTIGFVEKRTPNPLAHQIHSSHLITFPQIQWP